MEFGLEPSGVRTTLLLKRLFFLESDVARRLQHQSKCRNHMPFASEKYLCLSVFIRG
jgi:hypothetical protein